MDEPAPVSLLKQTDSPIPDEYRSVKPRVLAEAIDKSPGYIYARIRTGEIAARMVAGSLRVPVLECLRWIREVTRDA